MAAYRPTYIQQAGRAARERGTLELVPPAGFCQSS